MNTINLIFINKNERSQTCYLASEDQLAECFRDNPAMNHLWISRLHGLKNLPPLPSGLISLLVENGVDLTSFPQELPETLEKMFLDNCPLLEVFPRALPSSLMYMRIRDCPVLTRRNNLQCGQLAIRLH